MVNEIFKARHSVRSFQPGAEVTEEQLDAMLEAAMLAPSAYGKRPWRFIVVRDRAKIDALYDAHPYTDSLKTAALAIVVCGDETPADKRPPLFVQQDCAAATQNLMLQAAGMGIGTCWCGVMPRTELMQAIAKILDIESPLAPFNIIAVGVPAGPVEQRGFYDKSLIRTV